MPAATVCLNFDLEGVSLWLHTFKDKKSKFSHERGLFGIDVAAPRLLDLLDKHDIPATWFIPGHTIDSFPETCGEVDDRGHEIEHHGWKHHNLDFQDREEEEADFVRAIESIYDLTGREPNGYWSPEVDFTEYTLDLLQDLGFDWDATFMGDDFKPYYLRTPTYTAVDEPFKRGEKTDILEFPFSFFLDDFPAFEFVRGEQGPRAPGFAGEYWTFEMWKDQFDWMYENIDNGVYRLLLHPQIIGRAPRIELLESLIQHMQSKPNVEFATVDTVAQEIKKGDREI